jgi:uncharacterized protein involved in type VI secretion and phage assembly
MLSRSRLTDKRFHGVVEGIVTSVEDDSKEGRVKVKLPWFDDLTELECRVCQLYAGNNYGAFFIPEVGDEVLVAFIQGDMRVPVILGGLYNGQDKPPTFRTEDQDQKMIRTRGKHEILLDDTRGKERVRIRTQGGHEVDLSDEDKKVSLKTINGQSIEIDDQSSRITIKTTGNQSISLDATSGVITLTGPTTLNLEASSIALGGAAATQPLVLGAAFMALFNAHVHTPGVPVTSPPVTPMTPVMLSTISRTS